MESLIHKHITYEENDQSAFLAFRVNWVGKLESLNKRAKLFLNWNDWLLLKGKGIYQYNFKISAKFKIIYIHFLMYKKEFFNCFVNKDGIYKPNFREKTNFSVLIITNNLFE